MIVIPAYLVLAAIVYAVLVSLLITVIGRRLPRLVAARNEGEARLRFSLMRIRDHGETIALARTEAGERSAVARTYDSLVQRWLAMIRQRGRLTWITNGSGALVPVVPLLLAAPKYLSGEMSLGGVVQVAAAFVAVQNAFNWVLDNFMRIAEWLAAARRVNELADALERLDGTPPDEHLTVTPSPDALLHLDAVTLVDRDGRTLAADIALAVPPGATLHLSGELGLGKAALIQAIAGLWPWGRGRVALPPERAGDGRAAEAASLGGEPARPPRHRAGPAGREVGGRAAALRPVRACAPARRGARLGQGTGDGRPAAPRACPRRARASRTSSCSTRRRARSSPMPPSRSSPSCAPPVPTRSSSPSARAPVSPRPRRIGCC